MKTELEKEFEHIMLQEIHAKKDLGGSCMFVLGENGILLYDIENETLYLQDKKKLNKLHNQ